MDLLFDTTTHVFTFIIAFICALVLGPIFIPLLCRLKFGQTVRDDGPKSHYKKMGTPTMGGLIFIIPITIVSVLYARQDGRILPLLFVTLGFGFIGFIDDFIKVANKRKDGLYWNQKIFGLLAVAVSFAVYISKTQSTDIIIPFLGADTTFNMGSLFVPFAVIVLLGSTNAVNITDGLDGLAAGVTLVVAIFFTIIAMTRGEWDYIKIFCSAVSGSCLGFLAFNFYPARVFMGDMGSLALGGAVGAVALMMKMPLILFIVGGVYVIETLSVVAQVLAFKLTGGRILKMAPIHHHFELSGWREVKVVTVFWSLTVLFCVIGFFALRMRFY